MRSSTKYLIAAAISFVISAPVMAEVNASIGQEVQAAAGSNGNVRVTIDGDTVTLHGYVEDERSMHRIEQAAKNNGASRVINSVLKTN